MNHFYPMEGYSQPAMPYEDSRQFFGRPFFGRPFFGRPFFGRPFGFGFGFPLGFLGGLAAGSLIGPWGYGYPYYPYGGFFW